MGTPVQWVEETNVQPELSASPDPDVDFAAMAARHARFMFKVANGLLRNPHDAEDAVQESLLKLYRTQAWQHMEDEKAFLARTVWRVAVDIAARRPGNSHEPSGPDLASPINTPEYLSAEADQRALLRELIEGLPDELRQPLVLCAIEEMTSREVADVLGLTDGAVRTRVMRARAELKRSFQALQRKLSSQEHSR